MENTPSQEPRPEDQSIVDRFVLDETEAKELMDEANKITDLKAANISQLEAKFYLLQQQNPDEAQKVLDELRSRGDVPKLLELEKKEIQGKRAQKKQKEIDALRDKVRAEPKAVSTNLGKMLELRNVRLPDLFSNKPGHSKVISDVLAKMREQNKKDKK